MDIYHFIYLLTVCIALRSVLNIVTKQIEKEAYFLFHAILQYLNTFSYLFILKVNLGKYWVGYDDKNTIVDSGEKNYRVCRRGCRKWLMFII